MIAPVVRLTARVSLVARAATVVSLLAAAAGCSSSPTDGGDARTPELPVWLLARSDSPYITGRIVSRGVTSTGELLLRVRSTVGSESSGSRRPMADVKVHPDSMLRREDGSMGSSTDLGVGRAVVVWVMGPELESRPPQVTGSAILVER